MICLPSASSHQRKGCLFAQVLVPFNTTIAFHFDDAGYLQFDIDSPIVDDVIGELLFHPDDVEGVTHKKALALFEARDSDNGGYTLIIKTPKRFTLVVGVVATGASFRQATRILQTVVQETGI